MPTWAQREAARKEKYPESSGVGDMLLKRDQEFVKPIDCQRVMIQRTRDCPKAKITFPEDVVTLLREMGDYERERAMILSLDTKNNVISIENISTGSLNASIVHPREAVKGSLLANAAHIIFAHNHPSGDPSPSVEDRAINKKLQEAFNIVGIDMLDSIIIGRETYYSFKEHGEMFPESKHKESKPGGIMERKDLEIESDEDDACSIATMAALEVMSERCGGEGGTVNDALTAAKTALDHLSSEGKVVFSREIQKIHKTGEGWEVEIESPKFTGTLEISPTGDCQTK